MAKTTGLEQSRLGGVNALGNYYLEESDSSTIYDINNCAVDIPFPVDLDTTVACMGVIDYNTDLSERCLTKTIGCTRH